MTWEVPIIEPSPWGATVLKVELTNEAGEVVGERPARSLEFTGDVLLAAINTRADFELWQARAAMLELFGPHVRGRWRGAENHHSVK